MNLSSLRMITVYISALIAGICCLIVFVLVPSQEIKIIRLDQVFAFLSIIYLYLALLISPLYHSFNKLPYYKKAIDARRSIGVTSFVFAFLHSLFAFFGQLNGFAGLTFLSNNYLLSLILGFIGLEILMILALTSFDKAVSFLTFRKWKILHRFIYLGGIIILFHVVLLGTHYTNLSSFIPQITLLSIAFLLILEAIRFDDYLKQKKRFRFQFGPALVVVILMLFTYSGYLLTSSNTASLGIHAQHLLLAQQAQNKTLPANLQNFPGLSGDPNLRYTVSFLHDQTITPGQPTTLHFVVSNAANGEEVKLFSRVYEKVMHLIIVDEPLIYFSHIHPIQSDNDFSITTTFPKEGAYHLYIDFQPLGAIEQQMGFSVNVGNPTSSNKNIFLSDTTNTKTVNNYQITFTHPMPLLANELSLGQQQLTFTITNAKTHQPVTSLKPYLAAFGHLSMINTATFDFIHVHPTLLIPPPTNSSSGPSVTFLPLGLYGPITPGIYRVFAEFNPNNQLLTADFTVRVQ